MKKIIFLYLLLISVVGCMHDSYCGDGICDFNERDSCSEDCNADECPSDNGCQDNTSDSIDENNTNTNTNTNNNNNTCLDEECKNEELVYNTSADHTACQDGILCNGECVNRTICTAHGECETDSDCDENEFCKKSDCNQSVGECSIKKTACTDVYEPVCGCDGNTYSNECYASLNGVTISKTGVCNGNCTDSDGGKNYYEAGSAETVGGLGAFDLCNFLESPKGVLKEAICKDGKATHIDVICPPEKPYCNNAVCSSLPPKCTDSDNGIDAFTKGTVIEPRTVDGPAHTDYCENLETKEASAGCSGTNCGLREFYCNDPYITTTYSDIECPNGCENGACLNNQTMPVVVCEDTDGFRNFYTKGQAYGKFQDANGSDVKWWVDYCIGNRVYDFTCRTNVYPDSDSEDVWADSYICPYGCENGACLEMIEDDGPVTLWVTEGDLITRTYSGIRHEIGMIDVGSNEEYCGFTVDNDSVWIKIGSTETINGVKIGLTDVIAINVEDYDEDTCKIDLGEGEYNTSGENLNFLSENHISNYIVNGQNHIIKLEDINEKGDKCLFVVDNDINNLLWVQAGQSETISNFTVSVDMAVSVHSLSKNNDVCSFDVTEGGYYASDNDGWLQQNIVRDFNNVSVELIGIDNVENACKLKINGETSWFTDDNPRVFNGLEIDVEKVERMHSYDISSMCKISAESSTRQDQHLDGELFSEGEAARMFFGTSIGLENVGSASGSCGFEINNKSIWIDEGQYEVYGGIMLSVVDSLPMFYPKNSDDCLIEIEETPANSSISQNEYWLSQDNTINVDGSTIMMMDVTSGGDACGFEVDGIFVWIDEGKTEIVNGVNIGVINAYIVNDIKHDQDVCHFVVS